MSRRVSRLYLMGCVALWTSSQGHSHHIIDLGFQDSYYRCNFLHLMCFPKILVGCYQVDYAT